MGETPPAVTRYEVEEGPPPERQPLRIQVTRPDGIKIVTSLYDVPGKAHHGYPHEIDVRAGTKPRFTDAWWWSVRP